jgi:hypothetical protein
MGCKMKPNTPAGVSLFAFARSPTGQTHSQRLSHAAGIFLALGFLWQMILSGSALNCWPVCFPAVAKNRKQLLIVSKLKSGECRQSNGETCATI